MLIIDNIKKLKGEFIGEWQIMEVEAETPKSWLSCHHYCITLDYDGRGAAILIDRNINRLTKQYHTYVCYSSFDTVIYEAAFTKVQLSDKEAIIKHLMAYVNYEYQKSKK